MLSTGVVYMLAVLLVSSYWGLWMGLATAVLSALAFNFFHIPPTGRFTIAESENWVALVVFLVAAVVTSSARGRRARAAPRRRSAAGSEADLSAELARLLLGGQSVEDSLRAASQRIAQAFELPSVAIELAGRTATSAGGPSPDRGGQPHRHGAGARRHRPRVLDALQDRVVPGLETLVAAVRRREELESQVIETKALRRSNVVKTTLLRSVSHDLRSPLTAITAAAGGPDLGDALRRGAARAHLGDHRRERAALPPGGQPARPQPASGGRGGAARRTGSAWTRSSTPRWRRVPAPARRASTFSSTPSSAA